MLTSNLWFCPYLKVAIPSSLSAATSSSSLSSSVAEGDSDAAEAQDKDGKKKKNRCATCRKKVGLTGKHILDKLASIFKTI